MPPKIRYDTDTRLVSRGDSNYRGHFLLRKGDLGHDKHAAAFGKDLVSSHDKQINEREIHGTTKEAEEQAKD